MRRIISVALVLCLGLGAAALAGENARPDNTPPEGFVALFNGADLSGWAAMGHPKAKPRADAAEHWKVEDGVLKYDGKCTSLWTVYYTCPMHPDVKEGKPGKCPQCGMALVAKPRNLRDYVLMVDWRFLKPGDSGIYVRGSSKCQANIWCSNLGSGEVWGYRVDKKMSEEIRKAATPLKKADKPVGQWNSFVITVKGDRMSVALNGELVIDKLQILGCPKEGPIALQHHGNPLEFKNIYVKELPPSED